MKTTRKTGVLAFAALATALSVGSAQATSGVWSCSAGGFTGSMNLVYNNNGDGTKQVYQVWYKIYKGTNTGGNHANVHFSDGGTLPSTNFDTGDNGIQDNNWRALYNDCCGYRRGGGAAGMSFIFDKSNAPDPSCTAPAGW